MLYSAVRRSSKPPSRHPDPFQSAYIAAVVAVFVVAVQTAQPFVDIVSAAGTTAPLLNSSVHLGVVVVEEVGSILLRAVAAKGLRAVVEKWQSVLWPKELGSCLDMLERTQKVINAVSESESCTCLVNRTSNVKI